MYGGDTSNLPIKLNQSFPILLHLFLLLPTTVVTFARDDSDGFLSYVAAYLGPGQPLYYVFGWDDYILHIFIHLMLHLSLMMC